MGACGCEDFAPDLAFRLRDGSVLTYDLYRGCQECDAGIGVTLCVFTGRSIWVRDLAKDDLKANNYGVGEAGVISINILEIQDLVDAAAEIEPEATVGQKEDDCPTVAAWLESYGLRLMQGAIQRRRARTRATK